LVDLQDGLKVYGKNIRSLFCISTANSLDKLASFVDTQFKETDPASLNRTVIQRADPNHFAPIDKKVAQVSHNKYQKAGYQVKEPIKAQIGQVGSQEGFLKNQEMLIESPGFFGQCERTRSLKFLIDSEA
jgi:hypothetical protein